MSSTLEIPSKKTIKSLNKELKILIDDILNKEKYNEAKIFRKELQIHKEVLEKLIKKSDVLKEQLESYIAKRDDQKKYVIQR